MWAHWDIPSLNIWDEKKWSCELVQGTDKCMEVHFHAFPIFSDFLIQKAYESMDYHGLSWNIMDLNWLYGFMMQGLEVRIVALDLHKSIQKITKAFWSHMPPFAKVWLVPLKGRSDMMLMRAVNTIVTWCRTCHLRLVQFDVVHYSAILLYILASILMFIVFLLCWDWNIGWDDCGREFFHSFS